VAAKQYPAPPQKVQAPKEAAIQPEAKPKQMAAKPKPKHRKIAKKTTTAKTVAKAPNKPGPETASGSQTEETAEDVLARLERARRI
jgi:hypothetical protein